jgi:ubiquitin carboxyl-terminal hydrolase 5/13
LPSDDSIALDKYIGQGLQPNEVPLSETDTAAGEKERVNLIYVLQADILRISASALPEFDANAMSQLEGMGFPTVRCQKALLATGNNSAEAAMEWLFAHMDDPGKKIFS